MTTDYNRAEGQTGDLIEKRKKTYWSCCYGGSGVGTGILLVATGGFFLAREMGWISYDIPFWPLAIVVVGLLMIFRRF